MSFYYWTGATNGTWSTGSNWTPSGPPADGDTAVFDSRAVASVLGSDQSAIELGSMIVYSDFPSTLAIGTPALPITIGPVNCEINRPAANGSSSTGGKYSINFGTDPVVCIVHSSGDSAQSGVECVALAGVNSSNVLTVKGGTVGLGTMTPGQASTFGTINVNGGRLNVGSNATLTTVNVYGGNFYTESDVPTLNQRGGEATTLGTAKVSTAINAYGGKLILNGRPASGASIVTANLRGGTIDLTGNPADVTITTLSDGGGSVNCANATQLTATTTTLFFGLASKRQTNVS